MASLWHQSDVIATTLRSCRPAGALGSGVESVGRPVPRPAYARGAPGERDAATRRDGSRTRAATVGTPLGPRTLGTRAPSAPQVPSAPSHRTAGVRVTQTGAPVPGQQAAGPVRGRPPVTVVRGVSAPAAVDPTCPCRTPWSRGRAT